MQTSTPRTTRTSGRPRRTAVLVALSLVCALLVALPARTAVAATCPCTIFGSQTPANPSENDTDAVELGVKFRADSNGTITGLRFYKGSGNTGTHVGSLWSSSGTLLGQATFTAETATGWQQVSLTTPVAITANTTYVASYHATGGRFYDLINLANVCTHYILRVVFESQID